MPEVIADKINGLIVAACVRHNQFRGIGNTPQTQHRKFKHQQRPAKPQLITADHAPLNCTLRSSSYPRLALSLPTCCNADAIKMSQERRERVRKIPVDDSGCRSLKSGGLHGPVPLLLQKPNAGPCPWTYNLGGRDVRNVHQHRLRPVHVEDLAAGAPAESMVWLARPIVRRLQALAGFPQRVFPFGPIPRSSRHA